jgi:hypothetical protein
MTPAEVVELALAIGNRIDLQWGLFITVHLALLGAIVYIDRPLKRTEKIAALLMYLGFASVNYQQMSSQLMLIDAAYEDAYQLASDSERPASELINRMALQHEQGRAKWSRWILNGSHVLMIVLVFLSIIFDQALVRRNE